MGLAAGVSPCEVRRRSRGCWCQATVCESAHRLRRSLREVELVAQPTRLVLDRLRVKAAPHNNHLARHARGKNMSDSMR
eukprot:6201385-Pleurochrysis_carterae.AAC.1